MPTCLVIHLISLAGLICTGIASRTLVLGGLQRLAFLNHDLPLDLLTWLHMISWWVRVDWHRQCLNVAIWIGVRPSLEWNGHEMPQHWKFELLLTHQLRLRLLENPYGIKGATRLLEAWEAPWDIQNLRNFSHKLILFARRQESPRGCGHSFPFQLFRER